MRNQTLQQDKYRVAVYDADEVGQNACRTTGMIVAKHENGALLFVPDLPIGKKEWWVHPKQCRRLKSRERRRRSAACRGAEQEPWKFTHRQGDAVTCKLCLRMRERARAKYPELK